IPAMKAQPQCINRPPLPLRLCAFARATPLSPDGMGPPPSNPSLVMKSFLAQSRKAAKFFRLRKSKDFTNALVLTNPKTPIATIRTPSAPRKTPITASNTSPSTLNTEHLNQQTLIL
ncbi:MAG: hypothetical protein Q8Q59_12540, partial [Luteolibacter sp.]|nr:hypothetical protein [Luteolibacter sp.]